MRERHYFLLVCVIIVLSLFLGGCGTKYYTVQVSVEGGGSVLEADSAGAVTVASGTVVTLTPVAADGWAFANWGGTNGADVAANKILVNGNMNVTAVFQRLQHNLNVTEIGNGVVSASLVSAAKAVNSSYNHGDAVRLTATPTGLGWRFKRWTGDLTGSTNPVDINLTKDYNITAEFEVEPSEIVSHKTWGAPNQPCGVEITFNTPKDPAIAKVNIYRQSATAIKPYEGIDVVRQAQQTFRDEGEHLKYGEVYYYWVVPVDSSGNLLTPGTPYRVFMGVQNPASTLMPPQWVNPSNPLSTGWNNDKYFVSLNWNAITSGGVGGPYKYEVMYAVNDGTWTTMPLTGQTSVTIPFTTPGAKFTCKVRTLDAENTKSLWSSEAEIIIGGAVPQTPSVSSCEAVPGSRAVRIVWLPTTADVNGNAIDIANYRIYRSDNNGSFKIVFTTVNKDTTTWNDNSIPAGQIGLRYYVTAVSTSNVESAASNIQPINFQ